jgi:DNA/RNA-binding domain of Phe-tRNA-synthetase-like protein
MEFDTEVLKTFPGIGVAEGAVRSVTILPVSSPLERHKREVIQNLQSRYHLDTVKNDPVFRAYRDFFWKVGVDPTKIRPASEALVRRALMKGAIPQINTAVDGYNLASALSGIPIAAFDSDLLDGSLTMRFAHEGETFLGIGMQRPIILSHSQVILTDMKEIVAIYPYRDANSTRVTWDTRNIHVVTCGVPGVDRERVRAAYELCARYLNEYCGGSPVPVTTSP